VKKAAYRSETTAGCEFDLPTFLILLLGSFNCVKNNLFKNPMAVAPDRAKIIWIEALERGDTTIPERTPHLIRNESYM
jgi:hypothetical protein